MLGLAEKSGLFWTIFSRFYSFEGALMTPKRGGALIRACVVNRMNTVLIYIYCLAWQEKLPSVCRGLRTIFVPKFKIQIHTEGFNRINLSYRISPEF
jgi:hypothetical protein